MEKKGSSFWVSIFALIFMIVEIGSYIYVWVTNNETLAFTAYTNYITMFWSLFVVIAFLLLMKEFGLKTRPGVVWLFLSIGMALWLIGDFIWYYDEVILQSESLFPSWADYAYTLGYPILYIALFIQLGIVKTKIEKKEWIIIILLSLIFLIVSTILVIYPVLIDTESNFVEKFYSLVYPVGDVFLFILTTILVFRFRGGEFSKNWMLIATGFLVYIFNDLYFLYTEWMEMDNASFIWEHFYILASMIFVIGALKFRENLKAIG